MLGMNTLYKAAMRCSEEEDYDNDQDLCLFAWRFFHVFFFLFCLLRYHLTPQTRKAPTLRSGIAMVLHYVFSGTFLLSLPLYFLGGVFWMCMNILGISLLCFSFLLPKDQQTRQGVVFCSKWSLPYFFFSLVSSLSHLIRLVIQFCVAVVLKYILMLFSLILDLVINTVCSPLQTVLFFICDVCKGMHVAVAKMMIFACYCFVGALLCTVGLSLYGILPKIWLATGLLKLYNALFLCIGSKCMGMVLPIVGVCMWITAAYGLRIVALRLSMDSVSRFSDVLALNCYEQADELNNGQYTPMQDVATSLVIVNMQAEGRVLSFLGL